MPPRRSRTNRRDVADFDGIDYGLRSSNRNVISERCFPSCALSKPSPQANFASALSSSPNRGKSRIVGGGDRTAALLVVLLGLAAIAVGMALLLFSRRATANADAGVCTTSGCVDHAEILGLHRNVATVGPCEDFGEFVCSHWREKNVKVVPSVMIFRMGKWLLSLARTRWYEETGHAVAKRVTRLADACMRLESEPHIDDVGVAQLFHFITEELFPWILPEANAGNALLDDYAFALATIVNMSVVWNMPLWFTVDLVRLGTGGDVLPANWSVSGKQLAASFHSFLESRSAQMQRDVFGNLSSRFLATHAEPRFVRMRHMPTLVPKLRARNWIDALQSAFRVDPPLGEDDVVFATDAALLRTLNDLFRAYTAREVTYYTAWWFAQLMAAVSSGTIHTFVVGNKVGEEFYPVICGSQIAMAYNALLSGVDHGTAFQRAPVMRLLSDVHNTAVAKVRSWTDALDVRAIDAVASRLGRASTVLWPEEKRNGGADWWGEALYGPDYDNATRGFFSHWRESPYLATYDLVSNTISVGVQTVAQPFYAADGTSAINYGGLGFLYAAQRTTPTSRFRNAEQDLPLRGLEDYSAEQVFFLTACHVTCWENSSKHRVSPECSDAVRKLCTVRRGLQVSRRFTHEPAREVPPLLNRTRCSARAHVDSSDGQYTQKADVIEDHFVI
ncbi:hypothetical protein HPB51_008098 [Rhipicephalus microplus]|uniref:Uncharacterized protein n=1 Tax=Rhipicephalus microplus TaxID=6941 RepID=A0A9J6EMI0_RHIMP|nr:hypothetical protein HPB51_008098 [Rhipicephalus microplus]